MLWRGLQWQYLRLKRWLRQEPKGFHEIFHLILNVVLIDLIWTTSLFAITLASSGTGFVLLQEFPTWHSGIIYFISWWYFAAFREEVIFRWTFLYPSMLLFKKRFIFILILISLISSLLFGIAHYPNYRGNFSHNISIMLS